VCQQTCNLYRISAATNFSLLGIVLLGGLVRAPILPSSQSSFSAIATSARRFLPITARSVFVVLDLRRRLRPLIRNRYTSPFDMGSSKMPRQFLEAKHPHHDDAWKAANDAHQHARVEEIVEPFREGILIFLHATLWDVTETESQTVSSREKRRLILMWSGSIDRLQAFEPLAPWIARAATRLELPDPHRIGLARLVPPPILKLLVASTPRGQCAPLFAAIRQLDPNESSDRRGFARRSQRESIVDAEAHPGSQLPAGGSAPRCYANNLNASDDIGGLGSFISHRSTYCGVYCTNSRATAADEQIATDQQ